MITKETVIRAAVAAYPGNEALPADIETVRVEDLVKIAKADKCGDTLLSFVIIELFEGLDSLSGDEIDPNRPAELIDRAIGDLEAVRRALSTIGPPV